MCIFLLFCCCVRCFSYGGVYCCDDGVYVLFSNGVWICVNVSCVSSVVECGLFLESGFVLMFLVYLVLLNVGCFLSLDLC